MYRTLFHSLVAIFAAGVLLLQHAPLVQTGHGEHQHCIHCTGNYCTKAECDCGHAHPKPETAPSALRSEDGHVSESHQHAAHDHDIAHGPADIAHEHVHDAPPIVAVYTTLKTCGVPPSGIITITLDKFIASSAVESPSPTTKRPSSARYVTPVDQLVVNRIFQPPASKDRRNG